ncbi:MAG: PQQ-binding-like beta-propeller repeat protein [Pseudomonadota bacterium]
MHSRCILRATLAAALTAFTAAAQAQWAQDGFGAAKTFANNAETTLDRHNAALLQTRWQEQVGQFYASAAAHAGGRLFLCSNLYGALAQSPKTGEMLWSQVGASVGNCGTPVLAGDRAYLVSSSFGPPYRNQLSAVDQATGAAQWSVDLPAGSSYLGLGFGPALHNGRLFVSTARQAVMAVDAADGRLIWEASTGGGVVLNNDPSVGHGRVFVSSWHDCCEAARRQLFAFDAQSGQALWASDVDASNMQYPALVLNKVALVGSDSGQVHAFAVVDGQRLWSRQLNGYVSAPLAGHAHRVYVASGNRDVQALDVATGEIAWTRTLPGSHQVASNLAWANGVLYFTSQDFNGHQRLVGLNAGSGKPVAGVTLSLRGAFSKLSVVDGRVFLSTDGQLTMLSL